MSVYVDDYAARFRNMIMFHMIADTPEELLAMVDKIGIQRRWIQYPGTANEHFDICASRRVRAVRFGAIEIGMRDYARMVNEKESAGMIKHRPNKSTNLFNNL